MIKIDNLQLNNPFILAPMAGVTDAPFRLLCKRMGASLTFTEMISAKGLFYQDKNTDKLLKTYEEELPIGFQIFGKEPDVIKYVVKELNPRENIVTDINMGCPVPKIVKNGEGSFLMKDPDLVYDIVNTAVKYSAKPISVKIRLGWDNDSINALTIAKAIESGGASFISIHGRTRSQFYNGNANWKEIGKVKDNINIPVFGNGDVFNGIDAIKMMEETNVDGVMIGRGAMGNPWIFKDCLLAKEWKNKYGTIDGYVPYSVSKEDKIDMLALQFKLLVDLKGEYVAVRQIRTHGAWYLKGLQNASIMKQTLNRLNSEKDILAFFNKIKKELSIK